MVSMVMAPALVTMDSLEILASTETIPLAIHMAELKLMAVAFATKGGPPHFATLALSITTAPAVLSVCLVTVELDPATPRQEGATVRLVSLEQLVKVVLPTTTLLEPVAHAFVIRHAMVAETATTLHHLQTFAFVMLASPHLQTAISA